MEVLDSIQAIWLQIQHAPAHLLLILALNVLGFLAKKTPCIANQYIPHLLIGIGAVLYPCLVEPAPDVEYKALYPKLVLILNGVILGGGAWIIHRIVIKRGAKWLAGILPRSLQKLYIDISSETKPPFRKT